MNELVNFDYQGVRVRVVMDDDGTPWWVAADVCRILEIKNTPQALSGLDDDERSTISINDSTSRNGGNPNVNIINEPGVYSLIFRSRKKAAKAFKRWVTHEVLPELRRTGSYEISNPDEDHNAILVYQAGLKPSQRIKLLEMAQRMVCTNPEALPRIWKTYGDLCRLVGGGQSIQGGVREFLDSCCFLESEASVPRKELYEAYLAFCRNLSIQPLGLINFFKEISALDGVSFWRPNGPDGRYRAVKGLGLKRE
ncbi:BRO-N domain-containing protein [Desulfatibacillum aliphaticivorans]|uniref:BRO-N domain-containing protein n=1 Tax=Desulfatibacillum aliphaticivorans TaxID=218208 RepID=UPI0004007DA5|nr:BRO family protein [Desulfatibacillum aliphaticivorans]